MKNIEAPQFDHFKINQRLRKGDALFNIPEA